MRTRDMEDAQGSYNHEEEIIGFHVSMGNAETESNGRRDRWEYVSMRRLQREVQSYRVDNERIMEVQEDILQIRNMLQKQVNKDSSTNYKSSVRKVEVSRSHDRRDDHGGSRWSRSASRHHHHHSPRHSTRREYAHSRSTSNPSMSLVRHQRRIHGSDSL